MSETTPCADYPDCDMTCTSEGRPHDAPSKTTPGPFPRITGTTSEISSCGCRVGVKDSKNPSIGTLVNPWVVEHCLMHAAAPYHADLARKLERARVALRAMIAAYDDVYGSTGTPEEASSNASVDARRLLAELDA